MENTQTLGPEEAPVPIDQARFFDPIAPEYEELWRKLHGAAKASHVRCEEMLLPVLADPSLPKVIRDRAGLVALGAWLPTYPYEREGWTRGFGSLFGVISTESLREAGLQFTTQNLTEWIQDIADYEDTTGNQIVHPNTAFSWAKDFSEERVLDPAILHTITNWVINIVHSPTEHVEATDYLTGVFNLSCELYNMEAIDEKTFDDIIDKIPRKNLRLNLEREYETGDWGGSGTGPVQRPGAFTIITEGLNGLSTFSPDSRFTQWCKQKLHDWTEGQSNADATLPKWLSSIDSDAGRSLYTSFVRAQEYQHDDNEKDWSIVKEGVRLFGDGILLINDSDSRLMNTASKISDLDIRHAIVKGVLRRRAATRTNNPDEARGIYFDDSIALMEHCALEIGEESLIALVGIEKQLFTAEKLARAAQDEEHRQAREAKAEQDPKNIQIRQAKADFSNVLNNLREIYTQ